MITPSNPPAYPRSGAYDQQDGMTLRDYFAAAAMAVVINTMPWRYSDVDKDSTEWRDSVAAECFALADAMLAEREREGGEATS